MGQTDGQTDVMQHFIAPIKKCTLAARRQCVHAAAASRCAETATYNEGYFILKTVFWKILRSPNDRCICIKPPSIQSSENANHMRFAAENRLNELLQTMHRSKISASYSGIISTTTSSLAICNVWSTISKSSYTETETWRSDFELHVFAINNVE